MTDEHQALVTRFPFLRSREQPNITIVPDAHETRTSSGDRAIAFYRRSERLIQIAVEGRSKTEGVNLGSWLTARDTTKSIFRHEYGHHVHMTVMPFDKYREWDRLWQKHSANLHELRRTVSQYGASNDLEFFAESFAAYTNPTYRPGSLPPDVEAFMKSRETLK